MPSNEAADKVHNFFDNDNLSGVPHQSQVGSSNWQALNNNLWAGNQRQFGTSFSSNPTNYNVQHQNSEGGNGRQSPQNHVGTNLTQLSLRPEFLRSQSGNQQLNINGFMRVNQNLNSSHNKTLRENTVAGHNVTSRGGFSMTESQQGDVPEHNPNLIRKPEIAEAPIGFDFLGGQQQHMRGQQSGMPQSMMPLWQQQLMLKQIQDLQKQQQLQQLNQEARQQQTQMSQLPTMINGTPIRDTSNSFWPSEGMGGDSKLRSSPQMFMANNMHWAQQHGGSGSPAMQGYPNGTFSNEQGQQLRSMGLGLAPQQFDQSLYGAPIASTRGDLNQYAHLQGVSHDRTAMFSKAHQVEKSMMHSSPVSNSFQGDQGAVYQDQVQGKKLFGHAQVQGLNSGVLPRNFPQVNSISRNIAVQGFHGMHEQGDWLRNSQEKPAAQVGPSQGFTSLDPIEEKILFNTNDSTGFGNAFEGTDYINSFPSIQSGSWSALMQSAVAETSSGDTGMQDEWSGLSNVDNNLHSSTPFTLLDDSNMNPGGHCIQSFQQSERLQSEVSHESIRHSPKEPITWLDRSIQQKSNMDGSHQVQSPASLDFPSQNAWAGQSYDQSGNAGHSANSEPNFQNTKGSWVHRQNMPLFNMGGAPFQKPNGWNVNESQSPGGDSPLRLRENENAVYLPNSMPNSMGGLRQLKSGRGSPQIKQDHSNMNFGVDVPNSSITNSNQEINQQVSSNHHIEFGKNILNPCMTFKGYDNLGQYQHQQNDGLQVSESPISNYDRGGEKHGKKLGNSHQKETSSDSYNSNQSHHTISGGSGRQNSWLSASDSQVVASASQKSVGQDARILSGPPRKFQYHPMGNLEVDVDPANTTKHVTHLESLRQQGTRGVKSNELGHFGNSKSSGRVPDRAIDMEKECLADFQENAKGSEEVHPRGTVPGYGSTVSGSFDGLAGPSRTPEHTSQNMLELLHKVDQPREHTNLKDFGSTVHKSSSVIPEPTASDPSLAHLQQNQSSIQGFGLRLAPPSQRQPPNQSFPSQNFQQILNNLNSRNVDSEVGQKGPVQSLPSDMSQREQWDNISKVSRQMGEDASHQRNHPQHQQMSNASGQVTTTHSVNTTNLRNSAQQHMVLESVPVSQPSVMSGMNQHGTFPKVMHNVWNNVSIQQRAPGGPLQKVPETSSWGGKQLQDDQGITKRGSHQSEFGGCSINSQRLGYGEERQERESSTRFPPSEKIAMIPQKSGVLQERESTLASVSMAARMHPQEPDRGGYPKNPARFSQAEHTLANPSTSNSDIEAFGRSLKPSHGFQRSYSLLQQVQDMKGIESDANMRGGKRFKGPDTSLDAQHQAAMGGKQLHGLNRMAGDLVRTELNPVAQRISFQSGDTKMLSFSSGGGEDQNINSSPLRVLRDAPPRDVTGFSRNNFDIHSSHMNASSNRAEHPQISPSMAPSWFEQFGTFKSSQMQQISDAGKITKTPPQTVVSGPTAEYTAAHTLKEQINASDASEVGKVEQGDIALIISEPPSSVCAEAIDKSPALEPKKRKSLSSELLPWHKEVTHGSQRLQNISTAERDWAQAANRLIEKAEDEAEVIEDGHQMLRPRRRFVLSTQLMQQILRPAPPAILSTNATSDYDSLTYFHAKLALGDACSLISSSGADERVPPDSANTTSVKLRTSERICDQHYTKVTEDYIGRARKLETDLLRLDKRASILDVRVECQDLERFSVINRFVKFHGRGNADGAESSSASGAVANTQKQYPQRYVTAHAMPRNLPEGVQCLSL
ncbi:hypothetical protein GIB67_009512 [Kingdonia uniflora]|uniref:Uncharacterized protein n=1 Tax=Kingdonia uniflora TaxID=39325 RepID=A0A7J7NVY8_9MAGN|nr:hypothetical protein GIB67_009512 [Kingdonia uniflora]